MLEELGEELSGECDKNLLYEILKYMCKNNYHVCICAVHSSES